MAVPSSDLEQLDLPLGRVPRIGRAAATLYRPAQRLEGQDVGRVPAQRIDGQADELLDAVRSSAFDLRCDEGLSVLVRRVDDRIVAARAQQLLHLGRLPVGLRAERGAADALVLCD